jgi:hypothetical protein
MTLEEIDKKVRSLCEEKYPDMSAKQKDQLDKELLSLSLFPEFYNKYVDYISTVESTGKAIFDTNENNLIVPYVLGITSCPPSSSKKITKWSQYGDCPDIDTDIEDRDIALDIYYDIFGKERVLPVSNFNSIKMKTAIKDVARLYGVDVKRIEKITTKMDMKMNEVPPDDSDSDGEDDSDEWSALEVVISNFPDMQNIIDEYPGIERDINYVVLSNAYRTLSRHAGGIIVADNLYQISPVVKSKSIHQIGYSKNICESMGFIKLDLLGLKTLRIISSCIHQIIYHDQEKWREILERETGSSFILEETDADGNMAPFNPFDITSSDFFIVSSENPKRYPHRYQFIRKFYDLYLSPKKINFADQKVYKRVYQSGVFCGIFQMDSQGMRRTTMSFKPNCIEDISAAVAIYRPGPLKAGVHEMYAENKIKFENGEFIKEHPLIDKVLEPTYGLIVYQEQIMELGATLGKYTERQVQQLRQNVIKKGKDKLTPKLAKEREMLKAQFIKGALENGYEEEKSLILWDKIEGFAAYSFNKSHSVCYGMLSYITAYLLTYYKKEWYTAVMSESENPKSRKRVIGEAQADGVNILGPDLIKSKSKWSVDGENNLRFGFSDVKGIGEKAVVQVVMAQKGNHIHKGFENVWEFFQSPIIKWNTVNKTAISSLFFSGAFDSQMDEILQYFSSEREFYEVITNSDYRKLLTDHAPEVAIQKIKNQIENYKKRVAKAEEAGGKVPKEKIDIFNASGEAKWTREFMVGEKIKILNWMPEPKVIEFRNYKRSIVYMNGKSEEMMDYSDSKYMDVPTFIDALYNSSKNGNIWSIDNHPQYDKDLVPKCWFRIGAIDQRKTKAGKEFLVIRAIGFENTVSITCWEPYIFDKYIVGDYCLGFIQYDEKWGYSVLRTKPPKFKFPIERYPAIE